jgi:hypothetical protein
MSLYDSTNMKWIRNNVITLLFMCIIIGIIVSFGIEYIIGNCRIGRCVL